MADSTLTADDLRELALQALEDGDFDGAVTLAGNAADLDEVEASDQNQN